MKKFLAILVLALALAGCGPTEVKGPQMDCPKMGKPWTMDRLAWIQCEGQTK